MVLICTMINDNKMKKIIAVDIDNTVSNTINTWFNFTEIILREKGITPVRKPGIFSTNDAYGIERGSELHVYVKARNQELNRTNWKDYKVIKYAKKMLRKLKSKGYEVCFVSARLDSYFGDAANVTTKWLNYVGVPYDKVICNCEDKAAMCKQINAFVLIDDGLQYCTEAVNSNINAIYFDDENQETKQSETCEDSRIIVCTNWKEIYNSINSLYKSYQMKKPLILDTDILNEMEKKE